MTTITIKDTKYLPKTEFESTRELFIFLREELSPVTIFLADEENIPDSIYASVKKAEKEGENDVIDFKG